MHCSAIYAVTALAIIGHACLRKVFVPVVSIPNIHVPLIAPSAEPVLRWFLAISLKLDCRSHEPSNFFHSVFGGLLGCRERKWPKFCLWDRKRLGAAAIVRHCLEVGGAFQRAFRKGSTFVTGVIGHRQRPFVHCAITRA